MTRSCCRTCRLRFSDTTAHPLTTCPFCVQPLEALPAEATIGFKLMALDRLVADEAAIDRAARAARRTPPLDLR